MKDEVYCLTNMRSLGVARSDFDLQMTFNPLSALRGHSTWRSVGLVMGFSPKQLVFRIEQFPIF